MSEAIVRPEQQGVRVSQRFSSMPNQGDENESLVAFVTIQKDDGPAATGHIVEKKRHV
tara:strand:- start:391 stop:564 length:174 start_codon:yes stop_codon:yes gene_type:complete